MVAHSNNLLDRTFAIGTVFESGMHAPLRVAVYFYGAKSGYNICYWREGSQSIFEEGCFTAQTEADVWDAFRRKGWTIVWDDFASATGETRFAQPRSVVRKPFVWGLLIAQFLFGGIVAAGLIFNSTPRRLDWFVAAVPVLMLADFYLTLLYAWRVKRIWPAADLAALELNPMWKMDVARLRLFNVRHLIHVFFYTVFFAFLSQAPDGPPRNLYLFLFGICFGMNTLLVVMHIFHLAALSQVERGATQDTAKGLRFLVPTVFLVCALASALIGPFFFFGGTVGIGFERAVVTGLQREALGKRFWQRPIA